MICLYMDRNHFQLGDTFPSRKAVEESITNFAKGKFLFRTSIVKSKWKYKDQLRVICQRSGHPERKKNSDMSKQRNTPSLKVGCSFQILFDRPKVSETSPEPSWVLKHCVLSHSNGCNPGDSQVRLGSRRRGALVSFAIMSSLLTLVRINADSRQFRVFFQLHNLHHMYQDSQSLLNLKMKILRAERQNKLSDITMEELSAEVKPDELALLFSRVYKIANTAPKSLNTFVESVCTRRFVTILIIFA